MNRYEYRNTIRDLCGVNIQSFDPTMSFPADARHIGIEDSCEKSIFSDFLLQCYRDVASRSIEKAFQIHSAKQTIREVFLPNDMCDRKYHFWPQISFEVNVDGSYLDVGQDLVELTVSSETFGKN